MGVKAPSYAGLGNSRMMVLRSKRCKGFNKALSSVSNSSLGSQRELGDKRPSGSLSSLADDRSVCKLLAEEVDLSPRGRLDRVFSSIARTSIGRCPLVALTLPVWSTDSTVDCSADWPTGAAAFSVRDRSIAWSGKSCLITNRIA